MRIAIAAALSAALLVGVAAPVAAQASAASARTDLEFGVALAHKVSNKGESDTYAPGWNFGAAYRVTPLISIIAAITGDYQERDTDTGNIYTYAGGVRFESGRRDQRLKPLVQVVLGTGQDNGIGVSTGAKTNRYPVLTPGGGIDLSMSNRAALRIHLDFPLLMRYSDTFTGIRGAVALALSFGNR